MVYCYGFHRWAQDSNALFCKLDRFAEMDSTNRAISEQLKQLICEGLATISSNMVHMLESHRGRCEAVVHSVEAVAKRRRLNAKGLKDKLSKLQSGTESTFDVYTTGLQNLQSAGKTTVQNILNSTQSCSEAAQNKTKAAVKDSTEALTKHREILSSHREAFCEFTANQKGGVEGIVATARNGTADVRVRLSGVKRSAAEIRATVEQGIDESHNALESLARHCQETLAKSGRELVHEFNQKIGQFVASLSSEMRNTMNSTKCEVAQVQRKGVGVCDSHSKDLEALGSQVQVSYPVTPQQLWMPLQASPSPLPMST